MCRNGGPWPPLCSKLRRRASSHSSTIVYLTRSHRSVLSYNISPSLFLCLTFSPLPPMRWYRTLLRRRPFQRPNDHQHAHPSKITNRMSATSGMAAAALYSLSMSSPTALGAVPEDSAAKKHHKKHGKGFTNPWDSWRDFSPISILSSVIG